MPECLLTLSSRCPQTCVGGDELELVSGKATSKHLPTEPLWEFWKRQATCYPWAETTRQLFRLGISAESRTSGKKTFLTSSDRSTSSTPNRRLFWLQLNCGSKLKLKVKSRPRSSENGPEIGTGQWLEQFQALVHACSQETYNCSRNSLSREMNA